MANVFQCDCGCFCGSGGVCIDAACHCECHEMDEMSCTEIVNCIKHIDPSINVSPLAGMHRNTLFGWINDEMEAEEKVRLLDLASLVAKGRDALSTEMWVPSNIVNLVANIKSPVHVVVRELYNNGIDDVYKVVAATNGYCNRGEAGYTNKVLGCVVKRTVSAKWAFIRSNCKKPNKPAAKLNKTIVKKSTTKKPAAKKPAAKKSAAKKIAEKPAAKKPAKKPAAKKPAAKKRCVTS